MRIAFLIGFLLFAGDVFAQQTSWLEGRVSDENGQPLPGVNIYNRMDQTGAVSGLKGEYRIRTTRFPVTLEFSMIGFEKKTMEWGNDGQVPEVRLTSITYMSSDVVVAASRQAESQAAVPQSIVVIRAAELQERNTLTLVDALQYVPGVQTAGNQINIRGSSGFSYGVGSRVLLLLDGVPILGADTGEMRLDGLPMMMVERMEIIKGPGSALYGSGALGGIINLITKDYPEKPEIAVRSFIGGSEPVHHQAWRNGWSKGDEWRPFGGNMVTMASKLGEKGGFWVNAVYRNQSGWLENQTEYGGEFSSKATYRLKRGRMDAYLSYRRAYRENNLYWSGLHDPLSIGRVSLGGSESMGGNNVLTESLIFQPSFTSQVADNMVMTTRVRVLAGRISAVYSNGVVEEDPGTQAARYGFDTQFSWLPTQRTQVLAGVMHDGNLIFSDYYKREDGSNDRRQPEYGAYAQIKHKAGRLDLTAGLRYDRYEIQGIAPQFRTSPKVNLLYELQPALLLRASVGAGFRVPSVAERFISNSDFLPLEANPMLLPELSQGYEVGLRGLFKTWLGLSGQVEASVFNNRYKRLVEPKFDANLGAFQFKNLTSARVRGIEIMSEVATADRSRYLRGGYTWIDADDLTDGKPLAYRTRHMVNLSGGLHLMRSLRIGLDYRYASRPQRTDSDFSRFIRDADEIVPIHVVDGRLVYAFKGGRSAWSVSLLGRNLTRYYYVERPAFLAQPRNLALQIEAKF